MRSMSQHRFYWVYLSAIAHETDHTPEELHAWVKAKFLERLGIGPAETPANEMA